MTALPSTTAVAAPPRRRGHISLEIRIGGAIIVVLVVAAIVTMTAPRFGLADVSNSPFALPDGEHWLGTDNLGRDTFTRLFVAAGTSLMISAVATVVSAAIGTALGILAGYAGGITDAVIMRLCDVLLAIPAILMALIVRVIAGPGILPLIVAMSIIYAPTFARIMRAPVLAMRDRDFVVAAQLAGTPAPLIAIRHLLPNALTPLMVQAAITASDAILLEAGLSYLGQGVQPPNPSIGLMISQFQPYVQQSPLLVILPGVMIVAISAAWNLVADGLQATFTPRSGQTFEFLTARRGLASRVGGAFVGRGRETAATRAIGDASAADAADASSRRNA
jgi:ABC-type dipeptide/oligopeptide/nickel transport system permease subunit